MDARRTGYGSRLRNGYGSRHKIESGNSSSRTSSWIERSNYISMEYIHLGCYRSIGLTHARLAPPSAERPPGALLRE